MVRICELMYGQNLTEGAQWSNGGSQVSSSLLLSGCVFCACFSVHYVCEMHSAF